MLPSRHYPFLPWLLFFATILFLAAPILPILAGYDPLQENYYLLHTAFFFALLSLLATLVSVTPRFFRARWWLSIPICAILLDFTISFEPLALARPFVGLGLTALTILLFGLLRRAFPHWSWLGTLLFAAGALAALSYLLYASFVTYAFFHGSLYLVASSLLLLLELAALTISVSFLFEIVDALSSPPPPLPPYDTNYQPLVAIQVPSYNEPLSIMQTTLKAIAALEYPNFIVQVVDNNTPDPKAVKELQAFVATLGERFYFIHLDNWPGYKAGALNEATKRLPKEVEVLAIVDSDYVVEPNWLRGTVGYFANEQTAFVQTPQDYRDWGDNLYLRGLYYSYRYFFAVSMISRARRNAIIFAGTMGLIRRSAFEAISGWNQDVITEDSEASLRLLNLGYQGVYVPLAFGRGLMPLTFAGLKQQRFRWALGGLQILRLHTFRLVFPRSTDKLTLLQRFHYLFGNLQWFNELLFLIFTLLLIATAISSAFHHVLPIRQLAPLLLGLPLAFLFAGIFRALWAMRVATNASLADAFNALRAWFALSFVVSLAVLRGLIRFKTAFLRTPKFKVGQASWLQLFRAGALESLLALTALAATAAMLILAPSTATFALALLLLFQTAVYGSASWAAKQAEEVPLTPFRRTYMASAQSTGGRPIAATLVSTPVLAGFVVVSLVVTAALFTPPPSPATPLPQVLPVTLPSPSPKASPRPSPSTVPSPSPSPSPSPVASPSPSPVASPSPSPVASPSPSPPRPSPSASPRPSPVPT